MRIQLPEQVSIELPIAGYGSRALAYMTDFCIRWGVVGLLLLFLYILSLLLSVVNLSPVQIFAAFFDEDKRAAGLWVMALTILFMFAVEWGYAIFFEVAHRGVTPGKKQFGLRVVNEHGLPITLRESILRNVFLLVDLLPVFGLIGFVSMLLSSRSQRLGDLVAGTYVIYDMAAEDDHSFRTELERAEQQHLVLPLEHYNLLRDFLERRDTLDRYARTDMESQIAALMLRLLSAQLTQEQASDAGRHHGRWLTWVYKHSQPEQISYESS